MSAPRTIRPLLFVLAALAAMATSAPPAFAAPAANDQCYACHKDGETPQALAYAKDVHYQAGLTCADCHGGDASLDQKETGMATSRGYLGKFKKSDIPVVCGKCHGAGDSEFKRRFHLSAVSDSLMAGVHGEALRANEKGPQCVSCHGVHNILKVSDPASPVSPGHVVKTCATCHSNATYMRDFNPRLPVDQLEKYLTSVHGQKNAQGDPKPATCVSCHSNHMVMRVKDPRSPVYAMRIPATCAKCHADAKYMAGYHIPTDQYAQYRKSRHGIALLEHSDLNAPACNSCHSNHGAAPPGAMSVVSVCGNCHQSNAELFLKSPHAAPFEKQKLAACVVCHGNHGVQSPTDSLVSMVAPAPCAKCHKQDGTDRAAPIILHMRALLDSLSGGQARADSMMQRAEQKGMDVSDAKYDLKDVHQALVQSRVAIHSFKLGELADAIHPGIAVLAATETAAKEAVHDYYFRRQGLAVATLIVTIVIVLLWLKIREIERDQKAKKPM
jgi:predicted CXXCH cytochrome family protein